MSTADRNRATLRAMTWVRVAQWVVWSFVAFLCMLGLLGVAKAQGACVWTQDVNAVTYNCGSATGAAAVTCFRDLKAAEWGTATWAWVSEPASINATQLAYTVTYEGTTYGPLTATGSGACFAVDPNVATETQWSEFFADRLAVIASLGVGMLLLGLGWLVGQQR